KEALNYSASHIIVAHNHPSGDPTPSRDDIEITNKLVDSGKIMCIDILYHVIIVDDRHLRIALQGRSYMTRKFFFLMSRLQS
ncbi:MAG: hypothetical protein FIA99_15545, partial [Ruminiclostridium sp.]|nr:hypothetical protein [Ruminiclostridium sp.]